MAAVLEAPDTLTLLKSALLARELARPRSLQVEIGPSSLGTCRRQVGFKLTGQPEVQETELLPAILGTGVHSMIETALESDAFKETFEANGYLVEVEAPGIPGLIGPAHVDLYQPLRTTVTDWKSSTLKSRRYFPKANQWWQVDTYGLLLELAGYTVTDVELVLIPRDGYFKDIQLARKPYDRDNAQEALAWLEERHAEADSGHRGAPDYTGKICELFCPFYGPTTCLGAGKDALLKVAGSVQS